MTLTAPLVTIGMPVYNCERTVAESIASILNQTCEDWELVVYDDGSRDGTLGVARGFSDPRVRVVEGGANRGLPACLNEVIATSKGEYFARMDGDDIAYPDRLERQLEYLRIHRDVDLLGGSILVFRGDGEALGARRSALVHEEICSHPMSGIPVAHPTWLGRTAWFRANPYNADMVRMEDWELLYRTYRNSKFANLEEIVVAYREESLSLRKILVARRNKCDVLLRKAGGENAPWRVAANIAGQVAKSLVDIAAIGSKLNYRLLKHRVPPVSSNESAVWQKVHGATRNTVLRSMTWNQEDSA
jgi:glycosyltransferase involved in cell wall biosynthesis